jgi:hypothetical protein
VFANNRGNKEAMTRMPQGHCTLPADETGRILDRLARLEQVIRPHELRQALASTGRINTRTCLLTHEVVLRVVLALGLLTDLPIRQVFKHARRLRQGEESPHRSSLCVARQRLGVAPVRQLFARVVRPLARPDTPGAFYRGWRLMGIDGVVFDCSAPRNSDQCIMGVEAPGEAHWDEETAALHTRVQVQGRP